MDAKLVNPFIDAFTVVMPQMGFSEPQRKGVGVRSKVADSLGVSVIVGFTKQIRGNVVYNMSEDTAKYIASKMMMGMPVPEFNDMAQSAISEMSNMLTANAATNLAALGLEVDISTPSMTIGADFKIKISASQYLAINVELEGHPVEIDIAIAEN
jgi:chemotaxis protein CheX